MLLLVLSLCGLASAMSGRLVDPVVIEIAGDLNVPVGMVALLSTAYTLPFALSQPFLGPLGDLFAKARIVKIATVLLALLLSFAALAPTLLSLFTARVLAGMAGAAILPIGFALIGDAFPMSHRQVAISRFLAATLVGQIIGATLSGVLSHSLGWRVVFWSASALTATIALAALWCLPESRPANRGAVGLAAAIANYRGVLRNPRAWICFSAVFIEGAVIYGWLPFLGDFLRTLNLGGVREAGIIISGLALGGIVYTSIVPLLLTFINPRQMMAVGGVVAAGGLFCLSFGAVWPMQWAFMGVAGFGFFMLHNPIQTEVSELAPDARASAFSLPPYRSISDKLLVLSFMAGALISWVCRLVSCSAPALFCLQAWGHGGCSVSAEAWIACSTAAGKIVLTRAVVSQPRPSRGHTHRMVTFRLPHCVQTNRR